MTSMFSLHQAVVAAVSVAFHVSCQQLELLLWKRMSLASTRIEPEEQSG